VKLVPNIRLALNALLGATTPAALPTPAPTLEQLQHAESALGHRLPDSFKVFMQEAGSRHANFWETFWVGGESLGSRNIVRMNLVLRERTGILLPTFFVAFAPDSMGGYYVFDTRHVGPEKEYPVRHWEHEAAREENVAEEQATYRYFPEWLLSEVESLAT
jgi:hypothetical protein